MINNYFKVIATRHAGRSGTPTDCFGFDGHSEDSAAKAYMAANKRAAEYSNVGAVPRIVAWSGTGSYPTVREIGVTDP